ncbi:MAG TPA: PKD domain-containing protein [Planctomycetota bacterium]|nr:PKD domain-containing protein [Planctomycetota bacterium]
MSRRLLAFLLAVPWLCLAASHKDELNPTGDPIGGGPGYRDIKSGDTAAFVVGTREELIEALRKAEAGAVIFVRDDATIDMTGADDQTIPGGVTLASGRGRGGSQGALIFSNSLTDEAKFIPLFKTGGKGVRVTGLRLRGPFAEVGDHHYDQVKIANGIRADHEGLVVDNCELWAWDKWAIDLAVAGGAHIHHNYIHHTRRWGYGYGVWVRGGGKALIEANLFDFCRHHIGSGSQATSSYEARYNVCLYHDVQPSFDRHGNAAKAGASTLIHHNEFRNPDVAAILLRGTPLEEARFHHNWFWHASQGAAIPLREAVKGNVHIHDNHFGPLSAACHPVAAGTATPATGPAPLAVAFDASGSRDSEGGQIVRYLWNFADTPDAVGPEAHEPTARYTFSDPGRYLVALTVSNERGVPGTTWIPVTVTPPKGGCVLSAWVKDSYYGPLKGHYRKQALIDGEAVWEDDAEGDEGGWQHLVLDVGKHVEGKKEVELAFRLRADADITEPARQIVECFFYVDDVHLFGGRVRNGDFEAEGGWSFAKEPAGDDGFRLFTPSLWSGEARSGKRGCVLGNGYGRTIRRGAWTQVSQKIAVGPE